MHLAQQMPMMGNGCLNKATKKAQPGAMTCFT